MLVIQLSQPADSLQRVLVTQVAAQGVGRVGRIGDNTAIADDFRCLSDQTRLGVVRMDMKILAHAMVPFVV